MNVDAWFDQDIIEESYMPEKIVSATGAWDTCIAVSLTDMLDGYPLEETLQLATAAGVFCLITYDAISGLRSFEVLVVKISCGWPKQWIPDRRMRLCIVFIEKISGYVTM